jgi:DNA-directed RNA polymerase subunit RPC12/RpoP
MIGRMSESLHSELIHLTCPTCKQITSLSLSSLTENPHPRCPYCGQVIPVDLDAARQDGHRKALELDQSEDSLGSTE